MDMHFDLNCKTGRGILYLHQKFNNWKALSEMNFCADSKNTKITVWLIIKSATKIGKTRQQIFTIFSILTSMTFTIYDFSILWCSQGDRLCTFTWHGHRCSRFEFCCLVGHILSIHTLTSELLVLQFCFFHPVPPVPSICMFWCW